MDNPLKYSLTTRFKDRHILRLLDLHPGERVLDVGCGIGYLSGLAAEVGVEVCGVDMSSAALKHGASLVRRQPFACAGADQLPFPDDSFDKVIFADVIEHVPDDGAALREIWRVCRPGAKVAVATPAIEALFTETRMKTLLHGEEDQYLKNVCDGYTAEYLSRMMDEAGMHPEEVVYTNFYLVELLLGLTKLLYFAKQRRYKSQADLVRLSTSPLFELYKKVVFPIFLGIGRAEEKVLQGHCKGHCLIVGGRVEKKTRAK